MSAVDSRIFAVDVAGFGLIAMSPPVCQVGVSGVSVFAVSVAGFAADGCATAHPVTPLTVPLKLA